MLKCFCVHYDKFDALLLDLLRYFRGPVLINQASSISNENYSPLIFEFLAIFAYHLYCDDNCRNSYIFLRNFFSIVVNEIYIPSPLRVSLSLMFCRKAFKSGKRILWRFKQSIDETSSPNILADFLKNSDILKAFIVT